MKRIAVALVLVLGALVSTTFAHAAALAVSTRPLTSFSAQHPCSGPATAVPSSGSGATYSGVTITLASAACSGSIVRATVLTSAGTIVVQGQIAVAGTTATLAVPSYTAGSSYTVQATVAGWHLPTSWSFNGGPITVGNSNTALTLGPWTTSGAGTCVDVTVSSTTAQKWLINLNMNEAPFSPTMTAANLTLNPGWAKFMTQAPVGGLLQVDGGNGTNNVAGGTFSICIW